MKPLIQCISDRFNQEGYQVYSKLEQMLVNDGQSEEEIDEVLTFYGSDFVFKQPIASLT